MRTKLARIIESKWFQHPVFWVLSFYIIGSYFSISNTIGFIDFYYAAFFHIPLFALVYINLYYLIPNFLQKGKYLPFFLLSIFNIGLAYFLHEITFEIVIPILPTDYYMVSFSDINVLIGIFTIYWVFTTLFKLSKSWYHLQKLERDNLQFKLSSLKAQVNPHFLFNSLNSLYSLALNKSSETPKVILGLSDLMRYMLYEAAGDKVALSKEIEAIQNYLNLQKLRADESSDIKFETTGDPGELQIAPLLFIPLIENSFKHGVKGISKEGYVHIDLRVHKEELSFSIRNNKGIVDEVEKSESGGIGLKNVTKRLALIYGDRSNLTVDDMPDSFRVTVTIKL
ncbi:MAG: histidine kinase [Cyclobacteriaceae bacterium]